MTSYLTLLFLPLVTCKDDPLLAQYTTYPYPEFTDLQILTERLHYEDQEGAGGPHALVPDLTLENINHYLYQGQEDYQDRFRVLVAGGGVGSSTMFLAEQLSHTNAEIVYLDFSPASMAIAQQRAKIRNLNNIIFINDRIENIPNLGLGLFDLVESYGVLMILKQPLTAMKILQKCLKKRGGMVIMMYALYGRTGVYNMQALQQLVNQEVDSLEEEVRNAWKILDVLPPTNLFKRTEHLAPDHLQAGDAGLYDSLLIKRDQAYSIPDIMEMINMSGLHFLAFSEPDERLGTNYRWFVKDPALLTLLDNLSNTEQLAVGEIMTGNILKHSVYLSNERPQQNYLEDIHNKKLCFMGSEQTFKQFKKIKEKQFVKRKNSANSHFLEFIENHHNCTKSISEIFHDINMKSGTNHSEIRLANELHEFHSFHSEIGQLLLRKQGIGPSPLSVKFKELFDSFYTIY